MRKFIIIWIGQLASLLGSEMTNFAITIWAWQVTGQATPLALILFFVQTPRVIASLFAGVLVDCYSRKLLMTVGDLVAGVSTVALLLLFLSDNLQIWHVYCTAAVNSLFGFIQGLAYSASLSLLVTLNRYNRVTALNSVQMSGSYILAPALAGSLYPAIGLKGILIIDLATFIIAILTLSIVEIPQPRPSNQSVPSIGKIERELIFGFSYLLKHRNLLALLGFLLINNFIDSFNFAILPAMILARSNNDPIVWSRLLTTFGVGGVLGAATMSIWNIPKNRIRGLLLSSAVWKGGLVLLSTTQTIFYQLAAAIISGFCSPFPHSSSQGIWMSKIEPDIQGRVFATRDLIAGIATPLGAALAGTLVDRYFNPAMKTNSNLSMVFGGLFGNSSDAGMAVAMFLFSVAGIAIALLSFAFPILRHIEKTR